MYTFTMDVYSHHFVLTGFAREGQRLITEYAREFIEYQYVKGWAGEVTREQVRIFAASTPKREYYRFHRNALDHFMLFIKARGYNESTINRIDHPMYEPVRVEMPLLPHAKARDYQIPLVEHLCKPLKSKVLMLQTGQGKTFCALDAMSKLGYRTAIVIRPMYIQRWVDALTKPREKMLDIDESDILVVQGTKQLRGLIAHAKAGLPLPKIIIISNRTLQLMYDHYSRTCLDTFFYGCAPHELYELLGVGIRLIDEVHQDFHFNFLQDLYSHVPTTINLSATLESDASFTNRMYQWMFPAETRGKTDNYIKYIAVKALTYTLKEPERVKYLRRGRGSYSHVDFEKSIMRYKDMMVSYGNMIDVALKEYYIPKKEPGQKAIVFAATVDMCGVVAGQLQLKYPDLNVNKYTAEDDYDKLMESDICVSTIGSAGTAVDIPDLKYCLSTTAIGKTETNLQVMGRLRQSKRWPEMTPIFSYFVCLDVPQQVKYHLSKKEKFKGKVLSHQTVDLGLKL